MIVFLAAATGLVILTLQIAYLPTLYAAFNRRETQVALLNARAGVPIFPAGSVPLAVLRAGVGAEGILAGSGSLRSPCPIHPGSSGCKESRDSPDL
jgi:hypothetical protein